MHIHGQMISPAYTNINCVASELLGHAQLTYQWFLVISTACSKLLHFPDVSTMVVIDLDNDNKANILNIT